MTGDENRNNEASGETHQTDRDQRQRLRSADERSDRIARHLRDVYSEALREPVPDSLRKLLEKLDGKG